ncbi:endoglucanase B [Plectosphaerella cucumerina]|uniref:Endoglucanase B n=1 Tax=Plectosphaerella cucumerina TaxID=40658 RepID=A0A8K0TBQ8_9PEZI|nr:endoglucanase B [Plectosphaerella cucumerina]
MAKSQLGLALLLAASQGALAQNSTPWGQCGGINYGGPTGCPSGYYCFEQNPWYFQCIPGQAPTTAAPSSTSSAATTLRTSTSAPPPPPTTTSRPATTSSAAPPSSSSSSSAQPTASPGVCSGSFSKISAQTWSSGANPGWNLGNSLDAIPNEDSWNNSPVESVVFDHVVEQGIKSVRIPVTYTHHLTTGSPDWKINPSWLARVEAVIDQALARNLYVVTNVHHDSWEWADVTVPGADIDEIQERFRAIWTQIADKLKCKSSRLSFESINEAPANNAAQGQLVNEFNEIFLDAVVKSGGHNPDRVLHFVSGHMDPIKTSQWFEPPANVENPWLLHFHYYSPYDFVFGAWGKTVWGTAEELAAVSNDLGVVRGNFTDVPLVLGEYDVSVTHTEPAARWAWFDHVARVATDLDTTLMVWDNGLDHLDRNAGTWRDPVSLAIVDAVIRGERNSLPGRTVDPSATSQFSSAFIWNKVGQSARNYELPWSFNGNTLTGVKTHTGASLTAGTDYTTSGTAITFTQSFLSQFVGPTVSTGSKANLTLTFSAGAFSNVEIIQWNTPEFLAEPDAVPGQDLSIPIKYNGWKMVAAVKAVSKTGTYLFDDWTMWLGDLQKGRATFNNHWFFDGEQVVIRASAIEAVLNLNEPVDFTFEFYPRAAGNGNTLVYTIDPTEEEC